jgi:hypothetical protein
MSRLVLAAHAVCHVASPRTLLQDTLNNKNHFFILCPFLLFIRPVSCLTILWKKEG